jgi:guanylate kinase
MAFSTENLDLRNPAHQDTLTRLGLEIYDTKLKPILEPEHNGETVAIHVDTGNYALARNSPDAMRAIRKKYPTGLVVNVLVGPDQMDQLARRMLAARAEHGGK